MNSQIGSRVELLPEPGLVVDGQHRLIAVEITDDPLSAARGVFAVGPLCAIVIWGAVIAAWWILT